MVRRGRQWAWVLGFAVLVAAAAAIVWLTGSPDYLIERGLRSVLIGLAVGLAVAILRLGRPAVRALVKSTPWASRDYLVPGEPPPPPTYFVGRQDRLDEITRAMRRHVERGRSRRPYVLVIEGGPGIGKSGFALKAAALAEKAFPDGVIYASMTDARAGNERLANVLGDLVDTLQGPRDTVPDSVAERVRAFRRLSRRKRRVLYVYDDLVDEDVLSVVMPASSQAVVLITTRMQLPKLRGAEPVLLAPLAFEERVTLLKSLLGVPEPDPATDAALRRVAVATAGYPLALHLAHRAISSRGLWALQELTEDLTDDPDAVADPQAMLVLSVRVLTEEQLAALRSLAWLPDATFVPWMVQALADLPSEAAAWRVCERLADLRLVERVAFDAAGVVRLRLPDRVKEFLSSGDAGTDPLERERALARLADVGSRRRPPTADEILSMLDRGELGRALDEARSALSDAVGADPLGPTRTLPFEGRAALAVLAEVLAELGGLDDAVEVAQAQDRARKRARAAPPRDAAEVRLRRCLGKLQRRAGDVRAAIETLEIGRDLAREINETEELVLILRELAIARSTHLGRGDGTGRAREVLDEAHAVLANAVLMDDRRRYLECRLIEAGVMVELNRSGRDRASDEELQEALDDIDRALGLLPRDYRLWRAWLTFQRTRVLLYRSERAALDAKRQEQWDDGEILSGLDRAHRLRLDARLAAEEALRLFGDLSLRFGTARCRLEIGRSLVRDGEAQAAIPHLEEARETFAFCGDRLIEAHTAMELARVRLRTGQPEAAAAEIEFAERVYAGVRHRDGLREVRRLLRSGGRGGRRAA